MRDHLLIIIPTNGHGGCEYNALSLAVYLRDRHDFNVTISYPLVKETTFLSELCASNDIPVIDFAQTFEQSDNEQSASRQRLSTYELIRTVRPTMAFVPLPWPKRGQGIIAGCADAGLPTVVKFALVPTTYENGLVFQPAREALSKRQRWFANSQISAGLIEKHWGLPRGTVDAFHVGPIGLTQLTPDGHAASNTDIDSIRAELGIQRTAKVAITVARLEEQKGYRTFMAAALDLIADTEDLVLLWVGHGEMAAEINEWIIKHDLEDRVKLAGFRTDVRSLLRASDLFILPTVYEGGCSQALLEAMDEQLPIVVTDTSATAEVISHELNGLLIPVGDASALTAAALRLLDDTGMARRLALAAGDVAKFLSPQRSFEETLVRLKFAASRGGFAEDGNPVRLPENLRLLSRVGSRTLTAASPYFLDGWHDLERDPLGHHFRWMGSAGHIWLDVDIDCPAIVTIDGQGIMSHKSAAGLTLEVDGVDMGPGTITFKQGQPWNCAWSIPKPERPGTHLTLRTKVAFTPKSLSPESSDTRILSVSARRITIEQAQPIEQPA